MLALTAFKPSDLQSLSVKRILVPLDESRAAETALVVAIPLTIATDAELYLADVAGTTTTKSTPATKEHSYVTGEDLEYSARAYLKQIQLWFVTNGPVRCAVLAGYEPEEVVRWEKDEKVDLVIMTAPARKQITEKTPARLMDALLLGPCPVLLLRAATCGLKDPATAARRLSTHLNIESIRRRAR